MANKTLGIIGIVLGAGMVISNLLVAFFGWPWLYNLMGFPAPGFGWHKIVFILLGGALFAVGLILYNAAKKLNPSPK